MALRHRASGTLQHRNSSSSLQAGVSSPSVGVGGSSSGANTSNPTSVQVAVRIRPLTSQDQTSIPTRWQKSVVSSLSSNAVQVDASGQPPPGATALPPGASKRQTFSFDRVLGPSDGQEQVYNHAVMPIIGRFLEGYNVTILAYGQTSSGKSYTMGTAVSDDDFEGLVAGQRANVETGIIPRAVAQIFTEMRQNQARNSTIQYTAKVSFIEIYNEELIDLLSDDNDNKPLVQIREDKAGHIIWSGLREVRVSSVADVMNYLLQGSSIRRTNETDMNAQSSRSHAIFSLTLTQRRPAENSSPQLGLPPSSFGTRNSMLPRSTTPSGRSTPTGKASAGPRPASGIPFSAASRIASPSRNQSSFRPASMMNISGRSSPAPDDGVFGGEGSTEWITTTSKFHFVDLAGSERLKRTAAQGDRVKEGISINSGLHALGNVISALGDPAKSRRTTHIPYRDSKLTRLLQDSLGGNAYTLMIACVSPTEYNVSETVNTLHYANRARNIKNKAELNEIEVGWDDLAYLQGQILKLRREIQILMGVQLGAPGSDSAMRALEKREVSEWQSKFATLSQQYSQLLAEKTQMQERYPKGQSANDDFTKAAEPIIIEYEKTIDVLEGHKNLLRAELGHLEDVIEALEHEKQQNEIGIQSLRQELEKNEQTIISLQALLAKESDQRASAERYTLDLEAQLVAEAAGGSTSVESTANMEIELSKLRESESNRESYIKELEPRLSSAEDERADLKERLAKMEDNMSKREEVLRQRMELADTSEENKDLMKALDERDGRLQGLALAMEKLQIERNEAVRERGELNTTVASFQVKRSELEGEIKKLKDAAALGAAKIVADLRQKNASKGADGSSEEQQGILQFQVDLLTEELDGKNGDLEEIRAELKRKESEFETVEEKYKAALIEIDDLNKQITGSNVGFPGTPGDVREPSTPGQSPLLIRRSSAQQLNSARRGRPESLLLESSSGKRKSLSRRSSSSFLGYNPRESTPRDGMQTPHTAVPQLPTAKRNSTISATATPDGSPPSTRTRSLSQSLGPDSLSAGRRQLSLSGSADFAKLGWGPLPTLLNGSGGDPQHSSPAEMSRRIASLVAETKQLQRVLKERDDEIAELERTAKGNGSASSEETVSSGTHGTNDSSKLPVSFPTPESDRSISSFSSARNALDDDVSPDVDDLLRAMARKETAAARQKERLLQEIEQHKREKESLATMSESQHQNLTSEVNMLRAKLASIQAESDVQGSSSLREEHIKAIELVNDELKKKESDFNAALADRDATHLQSLSKAVESAMQKSKQEHEFSVESLKRSLQEEHTAALAKAIDQVHAEHAKSLTETEQETSDRHYQAQQKVLQDHDVALRSLQESHAAELIERGSSLQAEHNDALTSLSKQHDEALVALRQDHVQEVTRVKQEHQEEIASRSAQLDGSINERDTQLHKLKEEQQATLESVQKDHAASIESLHAEHAAAIEAKGNDHSLAIAAVRSEHESAIASLREIHAGETKALRDAHEKDLEDLQAKLKEAESLHSAAADKHAAEQKSNMRDFGALQQTHIHALEQLETLKSEHSDRMRSLAEEHRNRTTELDDHLKDAVAQHDKLMDSHAALEDKYQALVEQDPNDVVSLRAELSDANDALVTLQQALEEAQGQRTQLDEEVRALKGGDAHAQQALQVAQSQKEVEHLQASVANLRTEIQRNKSDIQGMLEEKTRQESLMREMQIKLTIAETRSASSARSREGFTSPPRSESAHSIDTSFVGNKSSPNFKRESSEHDLATRSSRLGLSSTTKPPPLTPPPNMPPPPTPGSVNGATTPTQRNSTIRSSTSSSSLVYVNGHRPESPSPVALSRSPSAASLSSNLNVLPASDSKTAKMINEQGEEIKKLTKQLNDCEQDLQANIDLVATLEAALNDSERNLRKSRVQLSEATRERERYATKSEDLNKEISDLQRDIEGLRSNREREKQGYESRLQTEMQAKEKVRRQLEARMDEVQKKKGGKLFCM